MGWTFVDELVIVSGSFLSGWKAWSLVVVNYTVDFHEISESFSSEY
jgi:hypothetical protein